MIKGLNFSFVEFVLTVLVFICLVLILILIPADIYQFFHDKETYARVYHLDMSQDNWELEYVRRGVLPMLISVSGIIIVVLRFKKPDNNIIRRVNYFMIGLLISITVINFISWWQSGFDH